MRSAHLRGRDHHRIGGLELISEEPTAIALSRGGARKTYTHTDPNEDSVAFAQGPVARCCSRPMVITASWAPRPACAPFSKAMPRSGRPKRPPISLRGESDAKRWQEDWKAEGRRALMRANQAILEIAGESGLPPAPTTFVVALVRPAENLLLHLSVGDSHCFAIDRGLASTWADEGPIGDSRPFSDTNRRVKSCSRSTRSSVCAAYAICARWSWRRTAFRSPGIGVSNPAESIFGAVGQVELDSPRERRATDLCRSVVEVALAAQRRQKAGDNMGCAALWLEGTREEETR